MKLIMSYLKSKGYESTIMMGIIYCTVDDNTRLYITLKNPTLRKYRLCICTDYASMHNQTCVSYFCSSKDLINYLNRIYDIGYRYYYEGFK